MKHPETNLLYRDHQSFSVDIDSYYQLANRRIWTSCDYVYVSVDYNITRFSEAWWTLTRDIYVTVLCWSLHDITSHHCPSLPYGWLMSGMEWQFRVKRFIYCRLDGFVSFWLNDILKLYRRNNIKWVPLSMYLFYMIDCTLRPRFLSENSWK